MSPKSIFCVAASHQQAERIADQLKIANFSNQAITRLFPDADTAHDSTHVLVSVSTANADELVRAKAIFAAAGAGDICTSGETALPDAPETTIPPDPSHSSVRYPCPV